jgi:hypothetical protein
MIGNCKEKILTFLNKTSEPVDVEKIRTSCEIGNWNTALKHCLELLIEGKIRGQKTSKGWIFMTHDEINPQPFQEVIGDYEALKTDENEVSLILSRTPTKMKLSFPKNSPEAKTLITTLQNKEKGQKIGILFTDSQERPLIVRFFNETTVADNEDCALWWLRKSILRVAFIALRLAALNVPFWLSGLRSWRSFNG